MPHPIEIFSKACARLSMVALLLAAAGLVLMTIIIGWSVFGRYVLNDTPTWAEAGALFLMSWFIILGAAVGVRESDHLGFEIGLHYSPPLLRTLLVATTLVIVGLFGLAMSVYGYQLAAKTWGEKLPLIGISKGWDFVPMIVGGLLIALFSVERLLLNLFGLKLAPLGHSQFEPHTSTMGGEV